MTKQEFFENYANELKANGFEVYVPSKKEDSTYAYIVRDNNIGYIQIADYFGGISFSTVHKPIKGSGIGTGFGLCTDRVDSGKFDVSIKDAEETFVIAPNWVNSRDREAVVKYKNWDEYVSTELFPTSYRKL